MIPAGLTEAKLGTRFVLPVRPIKGYEPVFDEHGLPSPVTPGQDVEPWAEALRALLTERALYEEESETSRERALRFVTGLRPERMAEYLTSLAPPSPDALAGQSAATQDQLGALSAGKRALLLQRLRAKQRQEDQ